MTPENKGILLKLLGQYRELGISEQIDYDKFYLYSIIVHSTAIEGSTVTEVEAQLLFDEGITSSKRTMQEQQMNLDLKVAYEYGREWIKQHSPITVDWLILLASKVMARTGCEYSAIGGNFSAAKGELRKLNVSAGIGGKSYMSYLKVPERLAAFCDELNRRRSELRAKLASAMTSLVGGRQDVNRRRKAINPTDVCAIYDLSFWAHYELVTIHPWADGNGRTSRLLMNLLQMEFGVLPSKVLKEDKATYIQSLIDTREKEDITIFLNYMMSLHIQHLKNDIDQYLNTTADTTQKNKTTTQKTLTATQKAILDYLKEHPTATRQEVAEALGNITEDGIKYHFSRLQKKGYLKREGGRKLGHWVVTT